MPGLFSKLPYCPNLFYCAFMTYWIPPLAPLMWRLPFMHNLSPRHLMELSTNYDYRWNLKQLCKGKKCVCIYIYICVCVYIHIYVCIYTYICVNICMLYIYLNISSVAQSCPTLSTPQTAACQASLYIINSWSLLKLISLDSAEAGPRQRTNFFFFFLYIP